MQLACDYKGTPLRLVNANLAVLYLALGVTTFVVYWYLGDQPIKTFDQNLYALRNAYNGTDVVPPAIPTVVTATNSPSLLIFMMMVCLTNFIFHMVYAIDLKRAYTIMLVDRCNFVRWIQFALVNTIFSLIAAHVLGTTSFDFFLAGAFFLPVAGLLGYFIDKSHPCLPDFFWPSYIGFFLVLLAAFWSPVICNFSTHAIDAGGKIRPYLYFGIIILALYHISTFLIPYLQLRLKMKYTTIELMNSFLMFGFTACMIGLICWAIITP